MNRSLILVTAAAVLGLAACTSTPTPTPTPNNTTSTPATAEPTTSVVTQTVTNAPAPPDKLANGSIGYGKLKLGMTLAEAQATGLAGTEFHVTVEGKCRYNDKVTITDEGGVERIVLPPDAKTSAGVGVGMTLAELKKIYPSAKEESLGYSVDIPGDARILFETSDTLVPRKDGDEVSKIKLFKRQLHCTAAVF